MTDEASERGTSWEAVLRRLGANPSAPESTQEYVQRKEREEDAERIAETEADHPALVTAIRAFVRFIEEVKQTFSTQHQPPKST